MAAKERRERRKNCHEKTQKAQKRMRAKNAEIFCVFCVFLWQLKILCFCVLCVLLRPFFVKLTADGKRTNVMTTKRVTRILMCVFLPTFLVVLNFCVLTVFDTPLFWDGEHDVLTGISALFSWRYFWSDIFIFTWFGYFLGVPVSLVCAAILECFFVCKLKSRSWSAVFLSAGLGFAGGIVLAAMIIFDWHKDKLTDAFIVLPLIGGFGFLVGLEMGLLIKLLDHLLPDKQPLTVSGR